MKRTCNTTQTNLLPLDLSIVKLMHQILVFVLFSLPLLLTSQTSTSSTSPDDPILLYQEDFSTSGLPIGWTTQDPSGNNVFWYWCSNPTNSPSANCPGTWSTAPNFQNSFSATTAENGFLTVNSDFHNNIFGPHISQITTTPFNFSDNAKVWVSFETHIGAFFIDPNGNAVLKASNNGGTNWVSFNCFPDFAFEAINPSARWSKNPETVYIDISSVAANQSEVFLQFEWIGFEEFMWSIDDIKFYDDDPRPRHDLTVMNNWYAIAPNRMTPKSEIVPIGFVADIRNNGSEEQTNVKLRIEVVDQSNGMIAFQDTIDYGTVGIDELVQNELIEDTFLPVMEAKNYKAKYTVFSDSIDLIPENNNRTFSFSITDSIFAKEKSITGSTAPSNNEWDFGEPHSWAWGNHFYIPNGGGKLASNASFGINDFNSIIGTNIFIILYKWEDANNNQIAEVSERSIKGFSNYPITNETPINEFITAPLRTLSNETVFLEDNTNYILMVEYEASTTQNLFISHSFEEDYGAANFRSEEDMIPQYIGMTGVGNPIGSQPYFAQGFSTTRIPAVRLHILDIVLSYTPLSPINKVTIFPNPVEEQLNISLDLERQHNQVNFQIFDTKGQLLQKRILKNIQHQMLKFEVSDLAAGTYLLQLETEDGNRTVSFIKQGP